MAPIQRKASSNDALYAIGADSTLDSRMSSTEVPQMELLKIDYVHQCKEAFMPNCKYLQFQNNPSIPTNGNHVARISINRAMMATEIHRPSLPPPPPTVESWKFLQNSQTSPKLSKKFVTCSASNTNVSADHHLKAHNSFHFECNNNYKASDSDDDTLTEDGVKSNSWNYHNKLSTCDIKRDIARAGIKSRADRIARIEKSECRHRPFSVGDMESFQVAVKKINEMFDAEKQKPLQNLPPQPTRPAPRPYQLTKNYQAKPQCIECSIPDTPVQSAEMLQKEKDFIKINEMTNALRKPEATNETGNSPPETITEHKGEKERNIDILSIEHQMLRNSRLTGGNCHKERVHIRKKRQSLLIVNHLNNNQSNDKSLEAKPWNISNSDAEKTKEEKNKEQLAEEECKKMKRCSLESHSDSGISSSSPDRQIVENDKILKLKNVDKCSDCFKSLVEQDASTKSEHFKTQRPSNAEQMENKKEGDDTTIIWGAQIKIQVGKSCTTDQFNHSTPADPNDVQNFSNKSLTKATASEAMSKTSSSRIHKQCNIENEQRLGRATTNNKNDENFGTTSIQIEDAWVRDDKPPSNDDDYGDTDSLLLEATDKQTALSNKPINGLNNSVKIFVRSSVQNSDNRSSCKSTQSYISQTSISTIESHSSDSTSGCSSSLGDNQSIGNNKERECDCTTCKCSTSVKFYTANRTASILNENVRRECSSPTSCTSFETARSEISEICVTCNNLQQEREQKELQPNSCTQQQCCNIAAKGIFWNTSCFRNDQFEIEQEKDEENSSCCCNICDSDDNCSLCENEEIVYTQVEEEEEEDARQCETNCDHFSRLTSYNSSSNTSSIWSCAHQQQHSVRLREPLKSIPMPMNKQNMRTHKLFAKTDIIHELRPRSVDGIAVGGITLHEENSCNMDVGDHIQSQQDLEARRLKRGHVLSELLETERIYVHEMSSILKGYYDQMHSEEMIHLVPASLQGKEDILFGNLHELYTFHNDVFLKDLENCISTTELVALCFVQRRDTFYRLYSFYCQNIPRSDRLRETLVDTHLFLQECQKRLGHKLPLAAYLLKPVQRITKYQLLLKDLLRFSDSGSCTKELQKALDCMLIVLKCVNDSMHQVAITGFPTDLAQQGELLLQDSFQVWSDSKKDIRLRLKPQQRHIFLYQKSMLFCKQTSKTGHNKSTYQFKNYLKMSQIGLTESVRGDSRRFEVWLQGRQEVHTLQAPTLEIKNKWVAEIKRVLLNQLEELKGEKIKQYGLNYRGLRQTTSWDTPNILLGNTQRTISTDASSESSNRNSNCSSSDDNYPTLGANSSSTPSNLSTTQSHTDKEPSEACGWSSDYSNSEDEMSTIEDATSAPGSKYIALADYVAMGHSEVSMREGDTVELLKVGCAGWWYVRILETTSEGWTPAAYLESINRKTSRSSEP